MSDNPDTNKKRTSVSAVKTPTKPSSQNVVASAGQSTSVSAALSTLSVPVSQSASKAGSVDGRSEKNSDEESGHGSDVRITSLSQASVKVKKLMAASRLFGDEEEEVALPTELPPDFRVLPVYQKILEDELPAMEIYPVFRPEEEKIDEVVKEMHKRIKKNPTYKTFVDETKSLLQYCLQERQLRRAMQENLRLREDEIQTILEKQKRDPRIPKIIHLAEHWRQDKDDAEQTIQSLLAEINTVTLDMKVMEARMSTMHKKQERIESQLQKGRVCDAERERLEEQVVLREKALLDVNEQVDALQSTVINMDNAAVHKEHEFKVKLAAIPEQHARTIAALSRELEMMSLEKEFKVQEARDLHDHVNALMVENTRCTDRIKMLVVSVRGLRAQLRSLELKHQTVVSQNKGLRRRLDKSLANVKMRETDYSLLEQENSILKNHVAVMKTKIKTEQERNSASLRKISKLQIRITDLTDKLNDTQYTIQDLKSDTNDAHKDVKTSELQYMQIRKMHRDETQKVSSLQRKLKSSSTYIRNALVNIRIMSSQMDRTSEWLKHLNADVYRCRTDNAKTQSTMRHLYRLLESSEDMVRLQTTENDALVISKNKMVWALRSCSNSQKQLSNEVAQLTCHKTSLEDSAMAHQFMLDFLETERDGAIRLTKMRENDIVIMQRNQLAKVAHIANCNAESSRLKMKMEELQIQLNAQKKEIYQLNFVLRKADQTSKQIEYWCKTLMHQRDMFGTKLLQQKTEYELSLMKTDTMRQMLDRANTAFREKVSDIKVLRKEIENLRRRLKGLEHTDSLCQELRGEVAYLSKNMCLEMNKRVALENLGPQRIHPHRDLKNQAPSVYELILKMQKLQRMVIKKTQECIAQEKEIAIRNDSIIALQLAVRRREQYSYDENALQTVIRQKDDKIKALTSEVRMLYYYNDVNGRMAIDHTHELTSVNVKLSRCRRARSAKSGSVAMPTSPRPLPPDSYVLNRNQSNKTTAPVKLAKRRHTRSDTFN